MPTIVDGGFRANVLPGSAEATVNMRLLPGRRPRPGDPRAQARHRATGACKVAPIGTTGESAAETLKRFDKRAKQPPSSTTPTSTARSPARAGASGRAPP